MPTISTITNDQDGLKCSATLAAPPTGALTWYASHVPDQQGSLVSGVLVAGTTYRLTVELNSDNMGVPIPFWITAVDNTGASARKPVWVRRGTDLDLPNEIALKLQDILIANKALLDLRIQRFAPTGSTLAIKQILVGMPEEAQTDQPYVNIQMSSEREEFWFLPLGKAIIPQVQIAAYMFHQSDISRRNVVTTLGSSIRDVLNQQSYLEITLPSTIKMTKCAVGNREYSEIPNGKETMCGAVLQWSCELEMGMPQENP